MTKLNAPLFSLAASGRVGDALHFAQTPAGPRVAGPMIRTVPGSAAQLAQRSNFQTAKDLWNSYELPILDRGLWQTLAATDFPLLSGYNVSLSAALTNLSQGLPWLPIRTQILGVVAGDTLDYHVEDIGVRTNYWARYQLLPNGPVVEEDSWSPTVDAYRKHIDKSGSPGLYRLQTVYRVAGVIHGYTGIAFATVV